MTDSSLAAFARLREAIAISKTAVRALCAGHGVSWQSFYKHARRQGWTLRQRRKRHPSALDLVVKLKDLTGQYLTLLKAKGALEPASEHDAMKIIRYCAATLNRLDAMEKKARAEKNARRRQKRQASRERAHLLAERIIALGRAPREGKAGREEMDRRAHGANDQCTDN